MKKIFLVDRQANSMVLESVLRNTDWYVQILIVLDEEHKKKYCNHERIGIVYTATEFFVLEETANVDFYKCKQYEDLFKIIDAGMYRIKADYQFTRYNFYMGVTIWEKMFDKYSPDLCLLAGIVHGLTIDSLMLGVARKKNVPGYLISDINLLITYKNWGDDILTLKSEYRQNDIQNAVKKVAHYYYQLEPNKHKIYSVKRFISLIIYKIGGETLRKIILSILNRSAYFTWYKGRKIQTSIFNHVIKTLQWKYITSNNDAKSIRANCNSKYVMYFLHFEPEATITHYASFMDSQIIIIKMIAQSLPKGWKFYVKEHPDSRKLHDDTFAYFAEFYEPYNSTWYWNSIRNTPNVEFIRVKEDATKLIKNASAVATIAGTVIMESILENIPCLVFGDARKIPYSSINGIYNITSTDDCLRALNEIDNSAWKGYGNIEKTLSACLLTCDENGYDSAVKNIIEDVKK